jgi:3-hydroxyisobutyrate dehydrogenase
MKKSIGFIGLGNMGFPMACNLLRADYPLCCFDLRPEPVRQLVKEGARAGTSPADVSKQSDVVITMLPDTQTVRTVILGPSGVIEGMRRRGIVIEMSTIAPMVTKEIAKALADRQIDMLDAPVGRGTAAAAEGTLTIMVGGDAAVLAECGPILSKMGTTIHHCGPVGTGATIKIVNNLVGGAILPIVAEALAIGVKAGLDPALMLKVMDTTAASNWHLANAFARRVLTRDFTPGFTIALMRKDLAIAQELADSVGVPMPLGSLVRELYATAVAKGFGNEDFAGYVRVLEDMIGVQFVTAARRPR